MEQLLSATTEHLLFNINKLSYSGYACNNSPGHSSLETTKVNGNKAAKMNTANDCGTYTRKLTSVRQKRGNGAIFEMVGKKGDYSTGDPHASPSNKSKEEIVVSEVKGTMKEEVEVVLFSTVEVCETSCKREVGDKEACVSRETTNNRAHVGPDEIHKTTGADPDKTHHELQIHSEGKGKASEGSDKGTPHCCEDGLARVDSIKDGSDEKSSSCVDGILAHTI